VFGREALSAWRSTPIAPERQGTSMPAECLPHLSPLGCEREVRDLPVFEFRTTVIIELYRVRCPQCGPKIERVDQLPSKAPFSKRFEDAVGLACEGASARQVARAFRLSESTVRAIDVRYLERWAAARRKPALRQLGVDEIHLGKKQKFLTVVCNLETGEPVWFGADRKKDTLDAFFNEELNRRQRQRIEAACVDMWEPYRLSIEQWAPQCRIVYDKFHIMQISWILSTRCPESANPPKTRRSSALSNSRSEPYFVLGAQ
jgi:transposase